MALTQQQVKNIHSAYVAQCQREAIKHSGYNKNDLDSNITALDAEFDNHVAALNASLSDPYKSAASVREKAILTNCLINERYKAP